MPNPCLTCGACCAGFRVSFYCGELDSVGGPVPADLTAQVGKLYAAMKGTEHEPPRCVALEGTVGQAVRCTIYDRRPAPCRDFNPPAEDGRGDARCDEVRQRFGLPPLTTPPLRIR